MFFYIDKNVFLDRLSLSSTFTSNKTISSSVLQGVFLRVEEDVLHMFASNLNSFFHTSINLREKTKKKEEVVVEPRKIIDFLSLLPDLQIKLEISDRQLVISSGGNKGTFPLIDKTDFPFPPTATGKEEKVETDELRKAISLTSFCAAQDEARPALTGINFIPGEENLLVSTDGFRLSLIKIKKDLKIPKSIIPAEFLSEIFRHVKNEKEISFFYIEPEKLVLFRLGQNEFYSRLIEGEAPPFEKVIPTEKKTKIILTRNDFLRNIKIISVFARELSNIIILEASKEGVILKPKTDKAEEAIATIEAKIEGEPQKIAFNYKFLLDFLNHTEGESIEIEILRPDAPVVFKTEGEKDFLHIIMPVRIQE